MVTLRRTKGAPLTHDEMDNNFAEIAGKAPENHGHAIGGIAGLQNALDVKVNAVNPSTSGTMTHGGSAKFGGVIGYLPSARRSVVQQTSKSTPVAINAALGQITLHGAPMAANEVVYLSVYNGEVPAGSVVPVSIQQDGSTDPSAYLVATHVFSTGGGFNLVIRNISGIPKSDPLCINFAVLGAMP